MSIDTVMAKYSLILKLSSKKIEEYRNRAINMSDARKAERQGISVDELIEQNLNQILYEVSIKAILAKYKLSAEQEERCIKISEAMSSSEEAIYMGVELDDFRRQNLEQAAFEEFERNA